MAPIKAELQNPKSSLYQLGSTSLSIVDFDSNFQLSIIFSINSRMKSLISLAFALAAVVVVVSGDHCPSMEAFLHDGFYYQFFDCPLNWDQAENVCKNQMRIKGRNVFGGHLVSIRSQEESDWLKFQLDMLFGKEYGIWIGAKRSPHSPNSCPDPINWVDGNRFSFKNFLKGQPNCRWPGEDCMHIVDNQRWNDAECQTPMRFVCKVKPINFDIGK